MARTAADRKLSDLVGVGPAMLGDFRMLGIQSVGDLAECDARKLYEELSELTGKRQDPCVMDVFQCAIEQARNPLLPAEQRKWWYWSRRRKENAT